MESCHTKSKAEYSWDIYDKYEDWEPDQSVGNFEYIHSNLSKIG